MYNSMLSFISCQRFSSTSSVVSLKRLVKQWTKQWPSILSLYVDEIAIYNLGHNILELYNVLIQTRLTTSKTKRDIYYSKLGTRVASRVTKIDTKLFLPCPVSPHPLSRPKYPAQDCRPPETFRPSPPDSLINMPEASYHKETFVSAWRLLEKMRLP